MALRNYRGMPPRTALVTLLVDTIRRPSVEEMTLADIHRSRATVFPTRPPLTWVTGRADPNVGISFGTAPARDGYAIPLRIYRPRSLRNTSPGVVAWFHGGGWVLGNVVNYDPICTAIATGCGAVVVSVDYRLAPEHVAPRAIQDCIDATRWVAAHAGALRADGSRLAVAGDSAGGNIAAVVAQVLRDDGSSAIRAQGLVYPATDLTRSSPSIAEHAHAGVLTRAAIDAFLEHYCPPGTDVTDPLLSPLFGNLAHLPPALVQTADLDPIRDDGSRYAAALLAAGSPAHLTNYRGVPHGFASMPGASRLGARQRRELVDFLGHHLTA